MKKVIMVTGASSGMGKEFVKTLLADGHIVYGSARRVENMLDIEKEGAKILSLDITDEESTINGVKTVIENEGRIDILINSAGFGLQGAIEDVPMKDARYQFEVNVFGLSRLVQLVLPHMRERRSGMIINISSVAGKVPSPMAGWYHASKHALEALSDSLRMEVKQFGIKVVIIESGSVKSEWGSIAMDSASSMSGKGAYQTMAKKYVDSVKKLDPKASDPSVITKLVQKAIYSNRPKARYVGGFMARPLIYLHRFLTDKSFDSLMLSQLKSKK
jgi:short-subunit dehydrogenase